MTKKASLWSEASLERPWNSIGYMASPSFYEASREQWYTSLARPFFYGYRTSFYGEITGASIWRGSSCPSCLQNSMPTGR